MAATTDTATTDSSKNLRQEYTFKLFRWSPGKYDCMWKLDPSTNRFLHNMTPIEDFMETDSKYDIVELYKDSMKVKVKYLDLNGEEKEAYLLPRRQSSMTLPTFSQLYRNYDM